MLPPRGYNGSVGALQMHLLHSRVEFYRCICITPEWSSTDASVALHSGVIQNPKYISMSQFVLLQDGAVYNTRQPLSN